MKSQTMARILFTVVVVVLMSWAIFFADAGMRGMAWLWMILGIALLGFIWLPWQKWFNKSK